MLSRTSLSALRALIHLVAEGGGVPVPPKRIAVLLGESPTYLAKVAALLVRAGILQARRGASGGVTLRRPAEKIRLLDIVEACQGTLVGGFCQEVDDLSNACAFHRAGVELHEAIVGVLSRWSLEDLAASPRPSTARRSKIPCWIEPPASAPRASVAPAAVLRGAGDSAASKLRKRGGKKAR